MSIGLIRVNGEPNSPDLKEYIMDSVSDVSSLPTDCADGSVAYTKDFSSFYTFFNGTWTEAGV